MGTQNYICLPDGAGAKWILFGPQATVFDDSGKTKFVPYAADSMFYK